MAGRHTNLALFWVTVFALVTGVGVFLVGARAGSWVVIGHGLIALAIVVLTPWKSMIAGRGLARRRRGRMLSVALTLVAALTLLTGFLLLTGEVGAIGPFTMMQLHVTLGVLTLSLTLAHTVQRPAPHHRTDLNRRNLLRLGGLLAAAGGLWLVVEGVLDLAGLRGGKRRFTGSHEIRDPAHIPATQWINDRVQHLDAKSHRVEVVGTLMSVAELAAPGDTVVATLDCTGGWYSTQEWAGTRLDRVLPNEPWSSVVVRSTTGYWRRFPREHARDLLLATHLAGDPLPDGNGGPVRLVAPGRRGYWWVKWVERVEVDDLPPWWQPPLPTA